MSLRTLDLPHHAQVSVDPALDELVLDGSKDRPSVQYFLRLPSLGSGTPIFYAFRLRERVFGEILHELCGVATRDEVQEAIALTVRYDGRLENSAEVPRLRELGFVIPGDVAKTP